MKFIHTADWHLGKLVQGVYMTNDQRDVLQQLIHAVETERPDAVIIAGDLYDRAVPPTEAVELLDDLFERLVIRLNTPVLAIAGNHDSPDRVGFASRIMKTRGLHLVGHLDPECKPVILQDEFGEVHVHLIPYADPAMIRHMYDAEEIRSHDDAARWITDRIRANRDSNARHIYVGHAFVTAGGKSEPNTSDAERPLSVGGAEHVNADYFKDFHYTALGHLHQAHEVAQSSIRYSGSPLKYSISEEKHQKGFLLVEMDAAGSVHIEHRAFEPLHDMRRVIGSIEEIQQHAVSEDYVFVTLTNDSPVLFPMEKVRTVYPNALHVERRAIQVGLSDAEQEEMAKSGRREADPVSLFKAFYHEVNEQALDENKLQIFAEVYAEVLRGEGVRHS